MTVLTVSRTINNSQQYVIINQLFIPRTESNTLFHLVSQSEGIQKCMNENLYQMDPQAFTLFWELVGLCNNQDWHVGHVFSLIWTSKHTKKPTNDRNWNHELIHALCSLWKGVGLFLHIQYNIQVPQLSINSSSVSFIYVVFMFTPGLTAEISVQGCYVM